MESLEKWPIDIGNLSKGDSISPEEIEKIAGSPQGTSGFAFAKLRLKNMIEAERFQSGAPLVVKHEANGLRVLTDQEAAEYTDKKVHDSLRQAAQNYFRQTAMVDAECLTAQERSKHERATLVNSRLLQALQVERVKIRREVRPELSEGPGEAR